jgi:hypothetical protein
MSDDELSRLRRQLREDLKLIKRAEQALAEIDRGPGLSDENADVLAALRIRIEGKERATLDDLLTAAGDVGSTKDIGSFLHERAEKKPTADWPEIEEEKRDWPGL